MIESRSEKYGRFLAQLTDYLLLSLYDGRKNERKIFLNELKNYSFKHKKKDESPNEGCLKELEYITKLDLNNPAHLAKLIKEGFHLMYQKRTSKKALDSLLKNL